MDRGVWWTTVHGVTEKSDTTENTDITLIYYFPNNNAKCYYYLFSLLFSLLSPPPPITGDINSKRLIKPYSVYLLDN